MIIEMQCLFQDFHVTLDRMDGKEKSQLNSSSQKLSFHLAGNAENMFKPTIYDDPATEMDIPYMDTSSNSLISAGNDVVMEEVLLGKHTVDVPSDLYENENIFNQFFSVDTWNDLLPEEVKIGLLDLLPSFPDEDIDEKVKTIEMLFGNENFHFGNPLHKFREDLINEDYFPDNVAMKAMVRSAQKRNYEEWMENYHFKLVQEILDSRKIILEAATGNVVTTPKIDRKRSGKGGNMKSKIRKRYLDEIRRIKKEVGEDSLSSDDEDEKKSEDLTDPRFPIANMRLLNEDLSPQHMKENIPIEAEDTVDGVPAISQSHAEAIDLSFTDDLNKSQTPGSPFQGRFEQEFPQSSLTLNMQSCFLSLLRDLFLSGIEGRLTIPLLDQALLQWQESPIAALNSWYQDCKDTKGWRAYIPSAIAFLCGSFPDQQPSDFVPFIEVDSAHGNYQWVGAGRDSDSVLLE
jgi:hypothetical protein